MNRTYYDITTKSLNKKNEELCGDKVEIVNAGEDVIVVLSDGLGSGVKANILATLTSKIIATMIKGGATLEDTVETVACTLPVCKVRNVAYSTFSVLKLSSSGRAHLTEFDSPGCLYFKNGEACPIQYTTREVAGKTIREAELTLAYGDVLTLISDGVMYAGLGAILNLGWNWDSIQDFLQQHLQNEESSARLTSSLIGACADLYMDMPGDDTTVATVRVVPRQDICLLSGPPERQEDDKPMIGSFVGAAGAKVVCGGSTANMVARVLQKKLVTPLAYGSDLPPLGYIEDIDLVTEGVLTLRQTNALLHRYLKSPTDPALLKELNGSDGASRLAKMLIEHCTHLSMFVGTAINPAHQNPNFPADLSIKTRLLEELADVLQKTGKQVDISYY